MLPKVSALADPTILAIETSCDESALAVLRGGELLASEVASQIEEHRQFGGVVPEVASRNHLEHLPRLLEDVLASAGLQPDQIDAFAATAGPGLASSLLIGHATAKGLAIASQKPFFGINHLEGHLLSPFFPDGEVEPNIALLVSGGHTLLVEVRAPGDYSVLGRTLDDAAGEAFDKVAKLLGLPYPGGPEIEEHARAGDPTRYDLPRGMLDSGDFDFSFSGLKTAVRYLVAKMSREERSRERGSNDGDSRAARSIPADKTLASSNRMPAQGRADISSRDLNDVCASFQEAVIEVLREKSMRAARHTGARRFSLSGGVSCNQALRRELQRACASESLELSIAEPWLCTDNAAMIAFAAMLRLKAGICSSLGEEIDPNLALV